MLSKAQEEHSQNKKDSRKEEADREETERGKGAFLTKVNKRRRPTNRGSPTKPTQKVLGTGKRERSRHTARQGERLKFLILKNN